MITIWLSLSFIILVFD